MWEISSGPSFYGTLNRIVLVILVVFGTRPEALKLSQCVRLAKSRGLPVHVHCTMQSPDLVDRAILPWDTDGDWKRHCLDQILKPRLIVVQGDTRTAFETAVAAYELGIPVFYVESGVRTYDLSSPWPEEGYRQMISRIATYHACTTPQCRINLFEEHLFFTRDTLPRVTGSPIVESVRGRASSGVNFSPYALVTLHRRENRGHFDDILHGVEDAGIASIWPSHPNGWAAQENTTGLVPFPPMNPTMFARAINDAAVIITDSGGVQEEGCCVGTPVVVAREKTDRPESLGKGGAILAGTSREGVAKAIREALVMDRSTIDRTIFGDGTASEQIVSWWAELLA